MNNELNNNTRTLIVSFVIAVMFLIPLRFVEVGNMMSIGTSQVLGEVVVLPNAEVEAPLLEAPYNRTEMAVLGAETDESSCYTTEEADRLIEAYTKKLEIVKENEMQTRKTVDEILEVEKNTCK